MWGVPSAAEKSASAAALAEALKRARYLCGYTVIENGIVKTGTTVVRDTTRFGNNLNKIYTEATYIYFEVKSIHYEDDYDNSTDTTQI